MRKISTILFTLTVLLSFSTQAQQCTTHIVTDTMICSGTQATLVADVSGPDNTLMGSNTGGNNHRGNMFDIVATNAVKILSFDASPMGNTTIEIYYKAGTWNGYANTPSAWTFAGSAPVNYTGGFVTVAVPVNVVIPAGQTYAFYVTSNTSSVSLNYSNGTNVGNVYSSDANISFLEGGGMEYPFTQGTGAVYQPRVWNGNIHYALAGLPTTYTWNTGETTGTIQSSLTNDTQFTVQTTITGCPAMYDTVTVHTSQPVVNAGTYPAICAGDSLTLMGSGTADTYTWDNGVTDSIAFVPSATATYTVVGTDSIGCTDTAQVIVTVNTLPVVVAGNDMDICSGTPVVLSGQGADQYQWDNGVTDGVSFTPMTTSTYIVEGTDLNGCMDSDTITVTVHTSPDVDAGSDLTICPGDEIILTASGAATYTWNNGVVNGQSFVPSVAGAYIVQGASAYGCTDLDTVMVNFHVINTTVSASGATLSVVGASGQSYLWFECVEQIGFLAVNGPSFTPTETGSYGVIITDEYGCVDTSACQTVDFAGLEEEMLSVFTVYPNPTTGMVTVQSAGPAIESVEIYDIVGHLIYAQQASGIIASVDLGRFQGTQFIARISSAEGFQLVKILKQ